MAKSSQRISIVPWGMSTDGAISFYIEKIAAELGKLIPTRIYNLQDEAQAAEAIALVLSGQVENWISVANMGSFANLFFNAMGEEHAFRMAAETRLRNVNIAYDWDFMSFVGMPTGTVYTQLNRSLLNAATYFLQRPTMLGVLPHASVKLESLPWNQRDHGVIFPGHLRGIPSEMRKSWQELPGDSRENLEAALELWNEEKNQTDVTPLFHLSEVMRQKYGDQIDGKVLLGYLDKFDDYLRASARFDLVTKVAKTPITFIGSGWDVFSNPRHTYIAAQPQSEVLSIMRRSKIVLNLTAPYFNSHERIFMGMSMKVPVGTYGKGFLANAGDNAPDEPIIYLEPDNIDEKLSYYLAHDGELVDLAMRARRRFEAHHTWAHRARALHRMIEEAKVKIPLNG